MKSVLDMVRKLLSEHFSLEVIINANTPLGGGCINHASKLSTNAGTYFMKWSSNGARDIFIREEESLNELTKVKNPYLKIPQVILCKEVEDTPGFIIMEYLEPGSGFDQEINLGRGLAVIHSATNDKFGFYNDNYCGDTPQINAWNSSWVGFFGEQRLWHLITLIKNSGGMDSMAIHLFEKLISKLPQWIADDPSPSLIHGDLWSGNYMHTRLGPSLIDPASYFADREMEMGIMTMFGGFSNRFWTGYNEIYPLKSDWQERNELYKLYHVLNHYHIFGGGYGKQAIDIARRFI